MVGVETCVKSLSDGAWDVAGVSRADVAATVDVSDAGSSAFTLVACSGDASDCCTSLEALERYGRATVSFDLVRFWRFFRALARRGKVAGEASGEYQGSCGIGQYEVVNQIEDDYTHARVVGCARLSWQ